MASLAARRPLRRAAAYGTVWTLRALALALMLLPIGLVIFLSFGKEAYTVIPPRAYSIRWYENVFTQREFVDGFWVSLRVALTVTPISIIAGTAAAYGLWRSGSRMAEIIAGLLYSPIMLPLVVTGLALLVLFSRLGWFNSFLNIVIGHVIITFPYSVRAVLAVLGRYDRQLDAAAANLGAGFWQTLWHVTLPLIRPGLFAGGLFAFVMSFDDFAVTIFLIDPHTRTLPVVIYQYMEFNLDPTVSAVSALLIAAAIAGTLVIEKVIGLDRFIGIRG